MKFTIGSDEVGLGAWAGPLYVCAVAVPEGWLPHEGVTDSKKIKRHSERVRLYQYLVHLPFCIMAADNTLIDSAGMKDILMLTHEKAIQQMLQQFPESDVVIDGILMPNNMPLRARCLPEADSLIPAVSAASIIAKVNRDTVMMQHHKTYPHYGWDTNAGYGTDKHKEGLRTHGITPLHRRSYAPIKKLLRKACSSTPT